MNKITYIFLLLICVLNAQTKNTSADKAYNDYNYSKAIEDYNKQINSGKKSEKIFKRLGDSYYFSARLQEANKWYAELMALNVKVEPEYLFRYAQTLKSVEDYKEANKYMAIFLEANKDDSRAILFNNNPDYLNDIEAQSGRYDIKALPFNTPNTDFAPAFFGDKLVFSSSLGQSLFTKFVHEWDDEPFIDLYEIELNKTTDGNSVPQKLNGRINTSFHESTATFTNTGKSVYFTRNSKNSEAGIDVNRLKILKSTLKGDKWNKGVGMPFNNDKYIYAHPALNADNSKLYFASNMPGTKGASDLFVVDIIGDNNYSEPKNLGSIINTEGRETFPFISETNKLYFASDGHQGLGGLDIFMVRLGDDGMPEGDIINLGSPVNGPNDDFSYIINETSKIGFFASNRKGGKGGDDIYGFKELKPLIEKIELIVNGKALDKITGDKLDNASISLLGVDNAVLKEVVADSNGSFTFKLDANKDYKIKAMAENYLPAERFVAKTDKAGSISLELLMEIDEVVSDLGDDLNKILRLKPIYFDFDKSFIRKGDSQAELDKLVEVMNLYPSLLIEVRSHTDSRANDAYNMKLSNRRAKATVDYVVSKGIAANRITGKGFGETQLLNACGNGSDCSKEEHELNRRSEFIIIGQ
jgi:outer membrane protein OmpA-like peptidoglycan-associated protein/tetratricopeptide (TPR) repeat protein